MAEIPVVLPDRTEIKGGYPIVIVGPNGSGKTRLSRRLGENTVGPIEFINALRNTRINPQLPAMSRLQAVQQHDSQRTSARNQPWELASDFDVVLAQLLADDGDAARSYRHAHKTGLPVEEIAPTAAELVESLWHQIFPGRTLDWKDWSPVVTNDRGDQPSYSANQMSDGERAALYLLAKVLLVPEGSVIVIDEPETHFHEELAVRLWDALEKSRSDLRFVYVTHDMTFALSRESAQYLLADPVAGLSVIEIDAGIPADIRRDILGAASFSYYASRAVFCEGEDHSADKRLLAAWFSGRDTVVTAVGSGDVVKQCVQAFNATNLVQNLEAVGIVDRDFKSEAELKSLAEVATVLPVHEIEGLLCLPEIGNRLARHLAKSLDGGVEKVITEAVKEEDVSRVAYERTKLRLLNSLQDAVTSRPASFGEADLEVHFESIKATLAGATDPRAIFEEERTEAEKVRASGDIGRILAVFPSKRIAAALGGALGMQVRDLVGLVSAALSSTKPEDELHDLGRDLEAALLLAGLPARAVAERQVEAPRPEG
jgi:AAA domain, putative AbiEii toxin, Type IV TA system